MVLLGNTVLIKESNIEKPSQKSFRMVDDVRNVNEVNLNDVSIPLRISFVILRITFGFGSLGIPMGARILGFSNSIVRKFALSIW